MQLSSPAESEGVMERLNMEQVLKFKSDFIRLNGERETKNSAIISLIGTIEAQQQEIDRLQQWVNDLQSGMYVNCVYCGHRYGMGKDTPVAMADVLKKHIEHCPKHPMSKLKTEINCLKVENECKKDLIEQLKNDNMNAEMNLDAPTADKDE